MADAGSSHGPPLPNAASILGRAQLSSSLSDYSHAELWSRSEQELIVSTATASFEDVLGHSMAPHLGHLDAALGACVSTLRSCLQEKEAGLLYEAILASCYNLAHALSKAAAMQLGVDAQTLQRMTLPAILAQHLVNTTPSTLGQLLQVVEFCSTIKVMQGGTPVKDTSLKPRLGRQPGNLCVICLRYLSAALACFLQHAAALPTGRQAAQSQTGTFVVVNLVSPPALPPSQLDQSGARQGIPIHKSGPVSDSASNSLGLEFTPPSRGSSFTVLDVARPSRSFISSSGSRDILPSQPLIWGSPGSYMTGTPIRCIHTSAGYPSATAGPLSHAPLRTSCSDSKACGSSSLSSAGSSRHPGFAGQDLAHVVEGGQDMAHMVAGFRTFSCAAFQLDPDNSPTHSANDNAYPTSTCMHQGPETAIVTAISEEEQYDAPATSLGHGISNASDLQAFKAALKVRGLDGRGLQGQDQNGLATANLVHTAKRCLMKTLMWAHRPAHPASQPQQTSQASDSGQRVSHHGLDLSKELDFEECEHVQEPVVWPGMPSLLCLSLAHAVALALDVHSVLRYGSSNGWSALHPTSLWHLPAQALGRAQAVILSAVMATGPVGCICMSAILLWCHHRSQWSDLTPTAAVPHMSRLAIILVLLLLAMPWVSTLMMPVLVVGAYVTGHLSSPLVAGVPVSAGITIKGLLQLVETLPSLAMSIWAHVSKPCEPGQVACNSYPAERAAMLMVLCGSAVALAASLWVVALLCWRNLGGWRGRRHRNAEAHWQVSASKVVEFAPDGMQLLVMENPLALSASQLIPAGSAHP